MLTGAGVAGAVDARGRSRHIGRRANQRGLLQKMRIYLFEGSVETYWLDQVGGGTTCKLVYNRWVISVEGRGLQGELLLEVSWLHWSAWGRRDS